MLYIDITLQMCYNVLESKEVPLCSMHAYYKGVFGAFL